MTESKAPAVVHPPSMLRGDIDDPKLAAALRTLELTVKQKLDGVLHGDHLGLIPGPGSEPGESRLYQPGDDVRRMDWAVTARTTHPHVRQMIADRELETWLVVDMSASLDFGTACCEKRDLAVAAAAAITFLNSGGGTVATGVTVTSRRDIPDADIVMLDLSPAAVLGIYGDVMPTRINRSYRRYRAGSSAFKVDFAIEGDVGWTNPDCRRAGTVHLGGTFAEIADTERQRAQGTMVQRPFVLVGQQYLADPSRSVGNINPIWAYAHVPFGYTGDATAAVIDQIERFAPGFRDRIVATVSTSTTELQTYNRNFIGGDIIGGANDRLQVIFRPRVAVDPYAIGVPGVYLCSQSAPPGAGIHGLCGYHAAESALRWLRKRR